MRLSRRTDFGRFRGGRWFVRGRSLPTQAITVGVPRIYEYVSGQQVGIGTVVAINVPRGTFWVTP
jgi:hypothetical protein